MADEFVQLGWLRFQHASARGRGRIVLSPLLLIRNPHRVLPLHPAFFLGLRSGLDIGALWPQRGPNGLIFYAGTAWFRGLLAFSRQDTGNGPCWIVYGRTPDWPEAQPYIARPRRRAAPMGGMPPGQPIPPYAPPRPAPPGPAWPEWSRTLNVPPTATPDQIKTAWRALVQRVHPDKGGSHDAFLRCKHAFEEAMRAKGITVA
jgi:hypothetical protein